MKRMVTLIAAAALLAGCEARIGNDAAENEVAGNASVEGKAESGRFTLKAPGVDISIAIPSEIRTRAGIQSDHRILPPDAAFSGIHVEGRDRDGGVEIAFTAPQAPTEVAAWYRAAERARDFAIRTEDALQNGIVLRGETAGDGDQFTVRLNPGAGGGTEGRIAIQEQAGQ